MLTILENDSSAVGLQLGLTSEDLLPTGSVNSESSSESFLAEFRTICAL
jgi:hypothetical protein